MNILEKLKDIITSIILIFILIFFLLMHTSGNITFRVASYDKKEDKPSINEIEDLTLTIISNLPQSYKVRKYDKNEVVSMHISYKDMRIEQKLEILKNIENQQKWQWIENNKNGSVYCHNQFTLTISEEDGYKDNYIDFLFISIGWYQYDDICRKNYYKNTFLQLAKQPS